MNTPTARRSARDLGPSDLVWDHFSRPRADDTLAKIHAASKAGYAAIGLYFGAWAALCEQPVQLERVDKALEETGIVVANIEVLRGWTMTASASGAYGESAAVQASREQEAMAYAMAQRWGCRYLQVIGDATGPLDGVANAFAQLCDRAAEHGLLVGLEWLPQMSNISDATTALRIVTEADRANGGLCVDAWHLTRSTNNLDDLRMLPGEKVFATQWNDGTIAPLPSNDPFDYREDCLSNRVPPGHGEFAVVEMVRILDAIGSRAPIGVEVCSTELWAAPVEFAAQLSADAMRQVLFEARQK
jgi:sugar phosphate isomerase/epimerase